MTQVRVLGPSSILDSEGEQVALGGPQQARLLAALAARAGEVVSIDALAEVLWSDGDAPREPQGALQVSVSRLRRIVGADHLVARSGGYVLEDVQVDIERAEACIVDARAAATSGDLDRAEDLFVAALGLWRGPSLADVADLSWAQAEAVRLEELRAGSREELAQVRIDAGRSAAAVGDLESLVTADSLREEGWRLLMVALHSSGRQAQALRAFERYRLVLAEETGLEPSPELVDLERQILDRDPHLGVEARSRQVAGYEIGDQIGEGAFGAIYKATQPSVGREVAIKVIRPELANDPEFVRRFEIEAQTVARLEHPHIVPLYDYWRDPSGAYLVMRYLAGGSAAARLVRDGGWPLEAIARLVDEVGPALAVAHDAGVVHRDVKPENILFDDVGNAYLADFGIATDVGISEVDLRSAGSPLYVSPEQVRDGEASPASDIYSFGVVLYELFTGRTPFGDSDSVHALLERKLAERVPPVNTDRREVPSGVDLVVQTATAADPTQRFASMGELVLAFRAATAGVIDAGTTTSTVNRPREDAAQTLVSLELETTNPYKGLSAFDESDAGDFYGREALAEELGDRSSQSRFVVVTGPSGSGKSSAVRAGLLPRLRESGAFVASINPGAHPMDELETALLRIATGPTGALLEQLSADERGLARAIRTTLPAGDADLVLVIDQFEELFTLTPDERRSEFLAAVAYAVTEEHSRLRVVATLRADFYDRPLQDPAISDLVRTNTVAVSPLSAEELDAAVTRPARRVGVSVEPALVAELVGEVRGNPSALPMLQYALTEVYERRESGRMTIDAYRQIGGMTGALANRADELHDQLPLDQQVHVRRLFTRLITPGEGTEDTRRRVLRSELAGVATEVIDAYGQARLLTFDKDPASREPTVEVAHEAIIREWPRLRGWLDEDRDGLRVLRHLGASADAWQTSGRDDGELYRSGRLETAQEWAAEHREDLTETEAAFLEASIGQRVREQADEKRRILRLRTLLGAVAVIAAIALAAGAVAFQQRSRANDEAAVAASERDSAEANAELATQREQEALDAQAEEEVARLVAEEARFDAETSRMANEAAVQAKAQPELGLLLAVEAYDREPSPATLGALQRAMIGAGPRIGVLGAGQRFESSIWLDDGRLLTTGPNGVIVFDVETRVAETLVADGIHARDTANTSYEDQPLSVVTVAGSLLAYVPTAEPNSIVVINIDSGSELANVTLDSAPLEWLAISPDGTVVGAIDEKGLLSLVEVGAGRVRWSIPAVPEQTFADFIVPEPVILAMTATQVVHTWAYPLLFSPEGDSISVHTTLTRTFEVGSGAMVDEVVGGVFKFGELQFTAFSLQAIPSVDSTRVLTRAGTGYVITDVESNEPVSSGRVPGTANITRGALIAWMHWDGMSSDAHALLSDGRLVNFTLVGGALIGEPLDTGLAGAQHLSISPDGGTAAVTSEQGVGLFAIDGRRPFHRSVPRGDTYGGEISIDGGLLQQGYPNLATNDPRIDRLYDVVTGIEVDRPLDLPRLKLPIGADVLVVEGLAPAFELRVYDLETFDELGVISPMREADGGANGLAVAVDRNLTATTLFFGDTIISDLGTGAEVEVLPTGDQSSSPSFNPEATRLVVLDREGVPSIWDTGNWSRVTTGLPELDQPLAAIRYSPDGRFLVSVDRSGRIAISDAASHDLIERFITPGRPSYNDAVLALDENSRLLAVVAGPSATLWDVETGIQIGEPFPNDEDNLIGIQDGVRAPQLITAEGRARLIWNLDVDSWRDLACDMAGRSMTQAEWDQYGPSGADYHATCS